MKEDLKHGVTLVVVLGRMGTPSLRSSFPFSQADFQFQRNKKKKQYM
jgi:hypothetical protein